MTSYLACMKKVKGLNDPSCRDLAKSYLSCRMERYVHTYLARARDGAWDGSERGKEKKLMLLFE